MKNCRSQILLQLGEFFYPSQHALHHVEGVEGRVQSLGGSRE